MGGTICPPKAGLFPLFVAWDPIVLKDWLLVLSVSCVVRSEPLVVRGAFTSILFGSLESPIPATSSAGTVAV